MNEELTKQLKQLTIQLQYKDMYETERKERTKVEDQLREAERNTFKIMGEELKKEVTQLKKQVTQQKNFSGHESTQKLEDSEKALYYKELNSRDEIYEKRINTLIMTFNRQLRSSEEVHRKELRLKVEEMKREETKKLEYFEEAHKKELNDLQCKVEELTRERVKKLEDSEETHRKELNDLQCKVEELTRERVKKLEDSEEMHRKELQLKVEEIKREETKKLEYFEEAYRKELDDLQCKVEELTKERVKKLVDSEETHRKEFNSLKSKIDELKINEAKKLEVSEKAHRNELHSLQVKVEELKKKLTDSEELQSKEISNLTLKIENLKREEFKKLEESFKGQKMLAETLKKDIEKLKKETKESMKQLAQKTKLLESKDDVISKLKDHEKNCKFEELEKMIKQQIENVYKEIYNVQLELEKKDHNLKLQLPLKNTKEIYKNDAVKPKLELTSQEKMSEEQISSKQHNKQQKQDKTMTKESFKVSKIVPAESSALLISPPPSISLEQPGHIQSTSCHLYSHAVTQHAHKGIKCLPSSSRSQLPKTLAQPSTQPNSNVTPLQLSINEFCPICNDTFDSIRATDACKHCKQVFCKACLDEVFKSKPFCPTCAVPLSKITGSQPLGGTMVTNKKPQKLPGYERYGTIQINYFIPSGHQSKEHPNPGQPFHSTSQTAYIPKSPQGEKVVRLLRKAFDAGLIFRVGIPQTSGTSSVVWNGIDHKTNISGGPSKSVTNAFLYDCFYVTIVMATQTLHI